MGRLTLQHFRGGLGQSNEHAIVDLEKTEKLERLPLLGVYLIDTLDTDDEGELRLCRNIEAAALFGIARESNLLLLCLAVLLHVLFSTSEDDLLLFLVFVCPDISLGPYMHCRDMVFEEGDMIRSERWLTVQQH